MTTAPIASGNLYTDVATWRCNNQKLDLLDEQLVIMENTMNEEYVAKGKTAEAEKSIMEVYGEEYQALNDAYLALAEKTPLDYSLMDGADDKTYQEQVAELAQDEIKTKDKNSDGVLDFAEYGVADLEDLEQLLGRKPTSEEASSLLVDSWFLFDNIDTKSQTTEKNSVINAEELEFFYENMDAYNDPTQSNKKDGIIDYNNSNDYCFSQVYESFQIHKTPLKDDILAAYKAYLQN